MEQSIEELRRILESGASLGSPQRSYFGVSPPARCNDGLVHDAMWQRDYHKGSRSNLQACPTYQTKLSIHPSATSIHPPSAFGILTMLLCSMNKIKVCIQALRELDQTGGVPFLRGEDACGDSRLILGSPDFSFLASYSTNHTRSGSLTCSAAVGRTRSSSPCDNKLMSY